MSRALAWLRRWGVSLASLAGGFLTLAVFRRGTPHVAWIVGYLLLLWVLVAAVTQARQALEARGHRLLVTAADYTIQTLYHGLLLFVLPAYWASTTLDSWNVLFLAVLAGLALVATVDPWYRALVPPRPRAGALFFFLATFAPLNVALPLIGVDPFTALVTSAGVAALTLAPVLRDTHRWTWIRALRGSVLGAVAAVALAVVGRGLVPPVPLALADATLARGVIEHEPVQRLGRAVRAGELAGGLVAFTAIVAPAGLRQPVEHVWRQAGTPVETVRLAPVRGGRRQGFRTWSRKSAFPSEAGGPWAVDVMTGSGQLIGRLRFQVTP